MTALTQMRLRELLDYDPETGIFTRRVRMSNCAAGTPAGSLRDTGYISISVDDRAYRAHLLAWLWMTGEWPVGFLDHKNMNKSDNRWKNLREANKSQNMANRGSPLNNSSGLKGVSPYRAGSKYGKPWQAGIQKNGKKIHIGHFATPEEAHAAYCVAAEQLFGQFAKG